MTGSAQRTTARKTSGKHQPIVNRETTRGRPQLSDDDRATSTICHVRVANANRAWVRDVARMRGMTIRAVLDWAIERLRQYLSTLPMGRGKA